MTADWLDQLAPDRAPPPVGWWPPAPGWWGVLALVVLLAAIGAWWWRRRRRRPVRNEKAWQRAALDELAQLETTAGDDAALAGRLQHLLRRYAVKRFGRDTVAALSGDAWIAFIAAHGGEALAGETGRAMLRCAFGGSAPAERARWLAGARAFLASAT